MSQTSTRSRSRLELGTPVKPMTHLPCVVVAATFKHIFDQITKFLALGFTGT